MRRGRGCSCGAVATRRRGQPRREPAPAGTPARCAARSTSSPAGCGSCPGGQGSQISVVVIWPGVQVGQAVGVMMSINGRSHASTPPPPRTDHSRTASETPRFPDTRSLRFSSSPPPLRAHGRELRGKSAASEGWHSTLEHTTRNTDGTSRSTAGAQAAAKCKIHADPTAEQRYTMWLLSTMRCHQSGAHTHSASAHPTQTDTHARSCSALSAWASEVSLAALEAPVLKLWRELSPDSLMDAGDY